MIGKKIRLSRIFNDSNSKTCIVPIDHGITLGGIQGIENGVEAVKQLINAGVDAVVMHKGIYRQVIENETLLSGNYLLHLSASTVLGNSSSYKVTVGTVEEGIKMGATGISIHVNLGVPNEPEMLKEFGKISKECYDWGMPLLAMMYAENSENNAMRIAHSARLAEELGADIIKINYPGSSEGVNEIVTRVNKPVIIAGGVKNDQYEKLFEMIEGSLKAGAAGVSIGRNIFQHGNTAVMARTIKKLVDGDWSVEECLKSIYSASLVEG